MGIWDRYSCKMHKFKWEGRFVLKMQFLSKHSRRSITHVYDPGFFPFFVTACTFYRITALFGGKKRQLGTGNLLLGLGFWG